MSEQALEKNLIAQPELWRLGMLLQPGALHVALFPPVASEQLIHRRFILDAETRSATKALEDVIYANPLLLSDFKSVTCLVDSPRSMAIPAEIKPADYGLLMERAFPLADDTVTVSPTGTDSAVLLSSLEPEMRGFLGRTFYNIRFSHHLAPLCRMFARRSDTAPALYMFSRRNRADLLAMRSGNLLAANTFECTGASDAAYYLLAVRHLLGLDADPICRIFLGGETGASRRIADELAKAGCTAESPALPPLTFRVPEGIDNIPVQLLLSKSCE